MRRDTVQGTRPGLADWSPPSSVLPGPHRDVALLKPLGRGGDRIFWAARSERAPGTLTVVEFLTHRDATRSAGTASSRVFLDLQNWAGQGWPPAALLTILPASLPPPYDHYELLSLIGGGPVGQVWMVESPRFGHLPLALKLFTKLPASFRQKSVTSWCEQLRLTMGFSDSHLARTYDVLDLQDHESQGWGRIGLVSPLHEPSLEQVLADLREKATPLPAELAWQFVLGLERGVQTLHREYGFTHGNLKASNVYVRIPEERPYRGVESIAGASLVLGDFGYSTPLARPLLLELPGKARPELGLQADQQALWQLIHALGELTGPSTAKAFADKIKDLQREFLVATINPDDPGRTSSAATGPISIPRYQILEDLGKGSYGAVYRARDLTLDRVVALKIFPTSQGRAVSARFQRETQVQAGLDHPHIVQIYDKGEIGEYQYIVMEFCAGGSLRQQMQATPGPWPPQKAAHLVRSVARALQSIHNQRVVHRDLKPGNILFTREGEPKIADFGLARSADLDLSITLEGEVVGTVQYMAPEQATGHGQSVGPERDVYSLGVILYELLTGQPPFKGGYMGQVLMQIREENPLPPRQLQPSIPLELEALCLACLQKTPQARPTAGSVANALHSYLEKTRSFGLSSEVRRPATPLAEPIPLPEGPDSAHEVTYEKVTYLNQEIRDIWDKIKHEDANFHGRAHRHILVQMAMILTLTLIRAFIDPQNTLLRQAIPTGFAIVGMVANMEAFVSCLMARRAVERLRQRGDHTLNLLRQCTKNDPDLNRLLPETIVGGGSHAIHRIGELFAGWSFLVFLPVWVVVLILSFFP